MIKRTPPPPRTICPMCHVWACRGNQDSTSRLPRDTEISGSARVYVSEEAVEPGGGVERAREMEAQMVADQVSAWPTVLTHLLCLLALPAVVLPPTQTKNRSPLGHINNVWATDQTNAWVPQTCALKWVFYNVKDEHLFSTKHACTQPYHGDYDNIGSTTTNPSSAVHSFPLFPSF